ncbi:GNAT family N-acetyltransferase [Streptomyces palmae]|uniref:GNAT family N-acetyltransferase n=1 Tax=Streptomyces palmae TaxID=1701085 RepID=A0A4Z0H842_9ACTN|nr:GNAT family N-acetyltransferase [Streptomyces palmae]TGB11816.1 GNAT family N-acetyltransferase [Streptomyces palmae]
MPQQITVARHEHVGELSAVLARAFHEDPVMSWIFPDPEVRRRALPKVFSTMLRHQHLRHGASEFTTDGSGRITGGALWDPPGHWKEPAWRELLALPSYIRASGRGSARAAAFMGAMQKIHPAEPHWYLSIVGTDPDPRVRGQGSGTALLRSRLDRCDEAGLPAYLESTNPVNVTYYERFGFTVVQEVTAPRGGPVISTMWRKPDA